MAKTKWNEEKIIKQILSLESVGEDLTSSNVKKIDSALHGAAVSYFGNWGNALEASGLDYSEIRKISQERRKDKVRKWTEEKVLEDIQKVSEHEDDLSYAYMKEKYSSLVAAASNYIGSWKKALENLGFDYSEVVRKGRKKRIEREKEWRQTLLLERLSKMNNLDDKKIKEKEPEFHKLLIQHFSTWRKVVTALRKMQQENGKDS